MARFRGLVVGAAAATAGLVVRATARLVVGATARLVVGATARLVVGATAGLVVGAAATTTACRAPSGAARAAASSSRLRVRSPCLEYAVGGNLAVGTGGSYQGAIQTPPDVVTTEVAACVDCNIAAVDPAVVD
jgi:hypothetical protein